MDERVDEIDDEACDDQSNEGFGRHGYASNTVAQAYIGREAREDENTQSEIKDIEHDLPPYGRLDRVSGIKIPFVKQGRRISFP